jgi:hypothetical protein
METLVTPEELEAKVPFVMDDDEKREAALALDTLSDDARFYGKATWSDASKTPRQVINLIMRAASRHMKNYDGYVQSRAGDESLSWTDRGEDAGSAYFTKREIAVLREMAGNRRSGFHTVGLVAYGETRNHLRREDLVRDEDGFPLPLYRPGSEL